MFKRNLKNSVSKIGWYNRFKSDQNGNVALIFALALIPVCFAVDLAIDYTRASDAQSTAQAATDAAALAAVIDTTSSGCPTAQKLINAQNAVRLNMSKKPWAHYNDSDVTLTLDSATGGCKVTLASGTIDTSISAAVGITKMNFTASSTAARGAGKTLEIAIALDNTGSMFGEMAGLKIAATNFVNTMFQKSAGGQMRIGLVPFVATVNPGKAFIDNSQMSDYLAQAANHGYLMSDNTAQYINSCTQGSVRPTPSGALGGGNGSDSRTWLEDIFDIQGRKFALMTNELLGIKNAHAAPNVGGGTTPPTDRASISAWLPLSPSFTDGAGFSHSPPIYNGQNIWGTQFGIWTAGCELADPKVNLFDMFNRSGVGGVAWKGCVMARPDPLDVNDLPPSNSNPNSKFVPYFWPSDATPDGQIHNSNNLFDNNYTANYPSLDGTIATAWPSNNDYFVPVFGTGGGTSAMTIFKYNGTDNGVGEFKIHEDASVTKDGYPLGTTWGPNKSCPNEVTPLTSDLPTLQAQINNLSFWWNGGTVTSEGLMWAWRVISPNLPYGSAVTPTLGANYYGGTAYSDSTVKKYIVLMTDGVNDVQKNGPKDGSGRTTGDVVESDMTAYGALWNYKFFAPGAPGSFRPPAGDFDTAANLLNERFTTACTNAKAQGITVYTIYFDHPLIVPATPAEHATTVSYLTGCSGASNFFEAEDSGQLNLAFQKIANSIGISARLVK